MNQQNFNFGGNPTNIGRDQNYHAYQEILNLGGQTFIAGRDLFQPQFFAPVSYNHFHTSTTGKLCPKCSSAKTQKTSMYYEENTSPSGDLNNVVWKLRPPPPPPTWDHTAKEARIEHSVKKTTGWKVLWSGVGLAVCAIPCGFVAALVEAAFTPTGQRIETNGDATAIGGLVISAVVIGLGIWRLIAVRPPDFHSLQRKHHEAVDFFHRARAAWQSSWFCRSCEFAFYPQDRLAKFRGVKVAKVVSKESTISNIIISIQAGFSTRKVT